MAYVLDDGPIVGANCHGNTETAVKEILRICKEENILMPFLMQHEKELQDIMVAQFEAEDSMRMYERDLLRQGREEGLLESEKKGEQKGQQKGLRKSAAQSDFCHRLDIGTGDGIARNP